MCKENKKQKKEPRIGNASVAASRVDFVKAVKIGDEEHDVQVRGLAETHECSIHGDSQLFSLRFIFPLKGKAFTGAQLEDAMKKIVDESDLLERLTELF